MKYALYRNGVIVACGTARDIAEKMGIDVKSVYWYASPAARRRTKNGTIAVRMEGDE